MKCKKTSLINAETQFSMILLMLEILEMWNDHVIGQFIRAKVRFIMAFWKFSGVNVKGGICYQYKRSNCQIVSVKCLCDNFSDCVNLTQYGGLG